MPENKEIQYQARRKINIAHFIGTLRIGGAENQVALLVNAMNPDRFNRHVVVMHAGGTGFSDALAPGVGFYSIDYRRRNALAALGRLRRYLIDNSIDVLHCHMYHAVTKGAVIGRLAAVPVIVTSEHGKNSWKGWHHHAIERYVVNRLVDKRIAVSEDIRQIRIREDGVRPNDIVVFPNTVDTNTMVKDNRPKPRIIGSLGRLVDAKDFPVLIHAIRHLKDGDYDVCLRIAGDGEERAQLEQLAVELGMESDIEFMGVRPAAEFLLSIDIFAMSSKREGVPVALLEAMARGLPIVSTAVGGIPEVVEDGVDGLLCQPGDPDALAGNIERLIGDAELRMSLGRNARRKVVDCYGTAGVVERWSNLYMALLAEKGLR